MSDERREWQCVLCIEAVAAPDHRILPMPGATGAIAVRGGWPVCSGHLLRFVWLVRVTQGRGPAWGSFDASGSAEIMRRVERAAESSLLEAQVRIIMADVPPPSTDKKRR